jgi:hypothetical protein
MSTTVHLPEELAARMADAASTRGVSVEQLALEAIEARFPAPSRPGRTRFPFVGMGDSGASGRDIGRRHREVIREAYAAKTGRDV